MKLQVDNYPLEGYMLLPPSPVADYRGVDRNPFAPTLLLNELDPSAQVPEGATNIWLFYPPGWRRDAYRFYEEHTVQGTEDTLLSLLASLHAAQEIQRLIEPHIGYHEIVRCEVWDVDSMPPQYPVSEPDSLGYDLAYPGGDFYSAILNGLFLNPHPVLLDKYKQLLNASGLFSAPDPVPGYLGQFRQLVPSEEKTEFSIFYLKVEH
jgi:hypothetical protein